MKRNAGYLRAATGVLLFSSTTPDLNWKNTFRSRAVIGVSGFSMGGQPISASIQVRSQLPRQTSQLRSMVSPSGDEGFVNVDFDNEAFERKNLSRKKFGLKPLSKEDFLQVEQQVRVQAEQHRQKFVQEQQMKQANVYRRTSTSAASNPNGKSRGLFENIFSDIMPKGCESNEDCENPEVCCDLVFSKVCCSSGVGVRGMLEEQYRPALVPVPARPETQYPDFY